MQTLKKRDGLHFWFLEHRGNVSQIFLNEALEKAHPRAAISGSLCNCVRRSLHTAAHPLSVDFGDSNLKNQLAS